jgi:hypothetical protein
MSKKEQIEAEKAWTLFHKRGEVDWVKPIKLKQPFPEEWGYLGRCKTTYYASDKWQKDRTFFERYYHDHDKRTGIWVPAGSVEGLGSKQPPEKWLKPPKAVASLGLALSFDIVRDGKPSQVIPARGALLVCSPDKRRLYVLEDNKVAALIWGPALRVEARGIVG